MGASSSASGPPPARGARSGSWRSNANRRYFRRRKARTWSSSWHRAPTREERSCSKRWRAAGLFASSSPPTVASTIRRGSSPYALAATLLAVALGGSLTRATTEAARLLEVGTSGVDGDRIEQRSGLPARPRRAIARALRFDPAQRLTSSSEFAEEMRNR